MIDSNLCPDTIPMAKVLILFAHPLLEKSRVQHELLIQVASVPGITINDLYQVYHEFDIDIERNLFFFHTKSSSGNIPYTGTAHRPC